MALKLVLSKSLSQHQRSLLTKIKEHAQYGFHRMNATTADCYEFSFDEPGDTYLGGAKIPEDKLSWSGGWGWSKQLVGTGPYVLMLASNELFIIE